ncbi:hypothetical protein MMC34_004176 [Xylographa carneopallida]|nr:hypothetical protein [Xylographa carneopallida]
MPRQLPLTPPDYYNFDNNSARGMHSSAATFYGANGIDNRYAMDGRDSSSYLPRSVNHSLGASNRPTYGSELENQTSTSYPASFAPHGNVYGYVGAPVLPPIRVPNRGIEHTYHHDTQVLRSQTHAPPKEEKVAGGVAAHLDYDMEQMVDFVSEMAQGMYDIFQSQFCLADIDLSQSVQPSTTVTTDFRKYVSQILTSTRLPSSTILLGLHYLATRMTMLSTQGVYSSSTGHLYHMITTALMLGSKFLDDNTFQNRSWAEVSHIPVSQLNTLEVDWLLDINWTLHIDTSDLQGFPAWLKQWERWQAKRIEITLDSLKLTPLDSGLRRQHSVNKQLPPTPVYSNYTDSMFTMAAKSHSVWQPSRHEHWPPIRSLVDRSPPSAPETGPNTPEWYERLNTLGLPPTASLQTMRCGRSLQPLHMLPSSAQSPYYTSYSQHYTPSPWSGHNIGCMCGYCLPQHERYSMAHTYGAQPVAA